MQKGQKVYFLHWNNIRHGIIQGIYRDRINMSVDFLVHGNLTLNTPEVFESVDSLIEHLKKSYSDSVNSSPVSAK